MGGERGVIDVNTTGMYGILKRVKTCRWGWRDDGSVAKNTVLAGALCLVSSTHMMAHNPLILVLGDLVPAYGLCGTTCMWFIDTHVNKTPIK